VNDLEEVIKKIIDIEYKAQGIMDDTEEEKTQKYKELEAKINDLKEDILTQAEEKVNQLWDREIQEAKEIAQQKNKELVKKLDSIEKYANENKGEWVDRITENIISIVK
jgi:hypothetical protein